MADGFFGLPFWPLEWLDLVHSLLIRFCRLFSFTLTPFAQYFCLFVKLRRHRIIQSHERGDLCFWGQHFFLRIDQGVGGRGVLYFWNHTLLNQFLLTELNGIFWIGFIWGGKFRRRCNFEYSFVLRQRRWLMNNRLRINIVRMMHSEDSAFLLIDAFGIFLTFRPNKHFWNIWVCVLVFCYSIK